MGSVSTLSKGASKHIELAHDERVALSPLKRMRYSSMRNGAGKKEKNGNLEDPDDEDRRYRTGEFPVVQCT
ncbi:MAG: hypothetical protein V1862_03660 [Methanobacteriota archaeon]